MVSDGSTPVYKYMYREERLYMLFTLALLPFILILTYEAVTSESWQTRRCSRITVLCMLTACAAFWL